MKRLSVVGLMGALCALGLSTGCAQTKMVQRDGCWVRQTETFPKTIQEEIGPCARREPRWSNDRVARLVQECMAEADYRWQTEALNAFSRGQPLPPQQSSQSVMDACMTQASNALVTENEALKKQVSDLTVEKKALQEIADKDRQHLMEAHDRMTDALGEAAKKPAPSAYATANSNGTASTQSEQTSRADQLPTNTMQPLPFPISPPVKVLNPTPAKKPSAPLSCNLDKAKKGDANCNPPAPEVAVKTETPDDKAPPAEALPKAAIHEATQPR